MKRLVLVALGLAVLAFLIARGSEEKPDQPADEPTGYEDPLAAVPLPETPHRDVLDEARGLYVLESEKARFSLELMREGRFRFLSRFVGKEQREAHGKWNLVGSRLTMVYERVNGAPPEGSAEVVNRYRGSSIELLNTGLDFPVVLQKRAMLKQTQK